MSTKAVLCRVGFAWVALVVFLSMVGCGTLGGGLMARADSQLVEIHDTAWYENGQKSQETVLRSKAKSQAGITEENRIALEYIWDTEGGSTGINTERAIDTTARAEMLKHLSDNDAAVMVELMGLASEVAEGALSQVEAGARASNPGLLATIIEAWDSPLGRAARGIFGF